MNYWQQNICLHLVRVSIIAIPVGIFFWLVNIALVPDGIFTTTKIVNERSPYIDSILPDARTEVPYQDNNDEWAQKIIGDPAFFFVHPQRAFPQASVEVKFKNTGVPIVELGVLADVTTGAYTLQPLQNLIIDNSSWSKIKSNGAILLQRQKKFASIDEFLSALPAREQIATYHFGLSPPYRLVDYRASGTEQTINVSLRGSHEFYTYVKNEKLNFIFSFMDMNRQVGEDVVVLAVINEDGQPVAEVRAQDDGDTSSNNKGSVQRELTLAADNLPEGVYKIQMKADDDIFFRTIKTAQQKITFLNQVWLADEVGYRDGGGNMQLWTEGKDLKMVTRHAAGVQTVVVGSGTVAITQPFWEYNYAPPESGLINISLSQREDLLIKTNGHFAFSKAQYFNPDPVRLVADTDLDRLEVNYIIANYTPPQEQGNWLVAGVDFDMAGAAFEDETWKFVFSLPTVERPDRGFLLHSIKMSFIDRPMSLLEVINKIWSYVFSSSR